MLVASKAASHFDRGFFAGRLKKAISRRGLTYRPPAELVRGRLPVGLGISHTSIWLYAAGRSAPRRMEIFRALCDVFDIACDPGEHDASLDEQETFSESQMIFTISGPRPEIQLLLRDTGRGAAFISFEAEVEWEKSLQIATILRNEGADRGRDVTASIAPCCHDQGAMILRRVALAVQVSMEPNRIAEVLPKGMATVPNPPHLASISS